MVCNRSFRATFERVLLAVSGASETIDFSEKTCRREVFATIRLFAEAERKGKETQCETAVGGVS